MAKAIAVLACLAAQLGGCAEYHTRRFVLDEKFDSYATFPAPKDAYYDEERAGKLVGPFLVYPEVIAFTNSMRVESDERRSEHEFWVALHVDDTSGTVGPGFETEIRSRLQPDTLSLRLNCGAEVVRLPLQKSSKSFVHGNPTYGVNFYYGGQIIPPGIDSIMLALPLVPQGMPLVGAPADSLPSKLRRMEDSFVSLYNP